MPVIQVTFDPTLWYNGESDGTTPGDNGYNAGSVWLDKDGTTAWAFCWFGAGFARFNISDGSIVHQGAMYGTPGYNNFWYNREDGTSLWQQDNNGYYYCIPNLSDGNSTTLNKFQIGSGTAGNLLDGYCTDPVTFDLTTMTPPVDTFGVYEDMKIINISGTNYLAINSLSTSGKCLYVINADTMTFVGSYQPSTANQVGQVFGDGSGNIWASFNQATTYNAILVKWNPGLGVTGSTLNAVETVVSTAVLGHSNGVNFSAYAGNNNCILGSSGGLAYNDDDGDLTIVNLSTFTQVAVALQNGTNFWSGTFDAPLSAMDNGLQPDSTFGFTGNVYPDNTNNAYQGGILNIFNNTTLALENTYNVTQQIINAGYQAGGTYHDFHSGQYPYSPMCMCQYSQPNSVVLVAYEFIGSAVYIVPTAPPAPPTIFAQVVPAEVTVGQNATLSWIASNATSLTSNELGTLALSGSMLITDPLATKIWQFHAVGAGGTADAVVVLDVYSADSYFSIQKLIITLDEEKVTPVRGRNG